MIRMAIVGCGTVSAFQKIVKPLKAIFPVKKSEKEITFNKSEMSYGQIIQAIDRRSGEKTRFRILHPDKGITIAPNEIIFFNS
jgi:hypothetical protein